MLICVWAPNVVWHQESWRDDELLTLQRTSLGHCSACKIWQIGTIYFSSLIGGGVVLNANSENKMCHERRSRFSPGGHQAAQISYTPHPTPGPCPSQILILSPSLDQWMNLN